MPRELLKRCFWIWVFLGECTWITRLSGEDPPPPVWVGITQPIEDWWDQQGRGRVSVLSLWKPGIIYSCPQKSEPPGPWPPELSLTAAAPPRSVGFWILSDTRAFLVLQGGDDILWGFLVCTIAWANSRDETPPQSVNLSLLLLFLWITLTHPMSQLRKTGFSTKNGVCNHQAVEMQIYVI